MQVADFEALKATALQTFQERLNLASRRACGTFEIEINLRHKCARLRDLHA